MERLDKKDIEILKELDSNFRISFSEIAKKVGLSKNSVGLRYQRLKELMLHNTTGINNKSLGYTLVKIFYVLELSDMDIEEHVIRELKRLKNVVYAARHYGHYNLEVALLVNNFDELNSQIMDFNKKFSKRINNKEIEIITKEFFFGNRFLDEEYPKKPRTIITNCEIKNITRSDKSILSVLRKDPRISILELAEKCSLTPKTAMSRMKNLHKEGIITGFFMMLDYSKFNLSTFKMLVQTSNIIEEDLFEKHLSSISNVKHFSRMLGPWDYEIDVLHSSILELQQDIEMMKQAFPNQIKRIEIISHGKRLVTNQERFLD